MQLYIFPNISIIVFNYYRYVYLPTCPPTWEGYLPRPPSWGSRLTLLARDLSLLDGLVYALHKLGPRLTQPTSALLSMSI